MNANSHSEQVWELLHQARAVLEDHGFVGPTPPLTLAAETPTQAEGYDDLAARYGELLALGTDWPPGTGSPTPLALVLTEGALSDDARTFVRSWFENPRVNLNLTRDFFLQPLPVFAGDRPPYQAWVQDLCHLLKPKALFSLGEIPAQKILGAPLSLDTLRGTDYRVDRWSMITTHDPEGFARLPESERNQFKAQVWKDLQRLLGKLKYG